jgi:hypothetical protein
MSTARHIYKYIVVLQASKKAKGLFCIAITGATQVWMSGNL